jgi:hypothetical protein
MVRQSWEKILGKKLIFNETGTNKVLKEVIIFIIQIIPKR